MEWKLAKTELPKKSGAYFGREVSTGRKKILYYTHCPVEHGGNSLFKKRPWDIEWLDESTPKLISDCKH